VRTVVEEYLPSRETDEYSDNTSAVLSLEPARISVSMVLVVEISLVKG